MTSSSESKNSARLAKNKYNCHFPKGSLVFIEGEAGCEMYIIRSGKIRILRHEGSRTRILATIGAGSVLGEMSLLDHQPRSATAQAVEPVSATMIDEQVFTATMKKMPSWFSTMVKVVLSRLRATMQRTTNDLVKKNIASVIRIIHLLDLQTNDTDSEHFLELSQVKNLVTDIIGLGDNEIEKILLHCILKQLLVVQKDENEKEYIRILNPAVLEVYMNFLRARQKGRKFPGEAISDDAYQLATTIMEAYTIHGRKIKPGICAVGIPQVEIVLQKNEKGRYVDPNVLDELEENKFLLVKKESTKTKHGSHTRKTCVFNESTLEQLLLLAQWIDVFREEVDFE